jgi:hypothetical protein
MIACIIAGLTQLEKHQERSISYRIGSDILRKEKYFFKNNVGEHSGLRQVVGKLKKVLHQIWHLVIIFYTP